MNKIFDCQLENTEVVGCDIMYCGRQEHAASSSGHKTEMESSTKIFIPTYQIMWCYIVNSDETVTQGVLSCPTVAFENHPPPPPKKSQKTNFTKF